MLCVFYRYHIPRSFTTKGPNTLILFEEVGGNTSQISLNTIATGTVCANTLEGNILQLSCQGNTTFSEIQFASYGNAQGSCGSFQKGSCHAPDALEIVKKVIESIAQTFIYNLTNFSFSSLQACIGQSQCSINVTGSAFKLNGCSDLTQNRLVLQAIC